MSDPQVIFSRADLAERFGCGVPEITAVLMELKVDRDKYDSIPLAKVNSIQQKLNSKAPNHQSSDKIVLAEPVNTKTIDGLLIPSDDRFHVVSGAELADYHFSLQYAGYRQRMAQLLAGNGRFSPSQKSLGKAEEVAARILAEAAI